MGLEFIGEKNINTTIGKRLIPITLSNKKEKYTPNFANDFSIKTCPKRRIMIAFEKKKIAVQINIFRKSGRFKLMPKIVFARNKLMLISIIVVTKKVTLSVNTFSSFKY